MITGNRQSRKPRSYSCTTYTLSYGCSARAGPEIYIFRKTRISYIAIRKQNPEPATLMGMMCSTTTVAVTRQSGKLESFFNSSSSFPYNCSVPAPLEVYIFLTTRNSYSGIVQTKRRVCHVLFATIAYQHISGEETRPQAKVLCPAIFRFSGKCSVRGRPELYLSRTTRVSCVNE